MSLIMFLVHNHDFANWCILRRSFYAIVLTLFVCQSSWVANVSNLYPINHRVVEEYCFGKLFGLLDIMCDTFNFCGLFIKIR